MNHRRHHRAPLAPTRPAPRSARNRGRCDFCSGEYQLRRDGGVRVHTTGCHVRGRDGRWRPCYCPGSALLPRDTSGPVDWRRGAGEPAQDHRHELED